MIQLLELMSVVYSMTIDMKKIALILMVLAGMVCHAQNTLSLSAASGYPNDEVTVSVSLDNSDAVSALEIVLPLENMTLVQGSAVMGERSNGHTITSTAVGNEARLYIYSLALNALNGNEGEVCSFKVKLGKVPATYTLQPSVILSDALGQQLPCTVNAGTITLLSPDMTLVTTSVNYGRVAIHGTYTKTVQVRNSGNEPLELTGITFDNEDFSAAPQQATIAPGSTQNISVTYAPIERNADLHAVMSISSNAVSGTKTVSISAIPFSVNELHVQRAQGIANEEVEVQLTVNNMEPLVGMQCTFSLPQQLVYVDGSFTTTERTTGCNAFASVSGQQLTLYLFNPTNQPWTGDDGVVATFRLLLDGRSGWYQLNPSNVILSNVTEENMTSATSGNYVIIQSPTINAPTQLNLGRTAVTETAQASYSIRNTGQSPLTVERIIFLDEGYSVAEELPIVIAPNATAMLTIQHETTLEGPYSTTMNVYSDDPTQRLLKVTVSGETYAANELTLEGKPVNDGYELHFGLNNWSTDLTALQMDIHWPDAEMTYSSCVTTSRLSGHQVMVIPLGDGYWRILVYSMGNAVITGNEGEIFSLKFTCENNNYWGTTVTVDGITVSNQRSENKYSGTDLELEIAVLRGDVNCDGLVSIADVTTLIDYLLGSDPHPFNQVAADVNSDSKINITDVTALIDKLLDSN